MSLMRGRRSVGGLHCLLAGLLLFPAGCTTGGRETGRAKESQPTATHGNAPPAEGSGKESPKEREVDAHAHFAAGVIEELRGETKRAEEQYWQAALNDPGNEPLVIELSQRLLQEQKADQAVTLLEKAARQPDATGLIDGWLGMAQAQLGRTNAAVTAFRRAIQKSPSSLLGYHGLAQLYLQTKRPQQALKVIDDAVPGASGNAGFLVGLAEFLAVSSRAKTLSADDAKPRVLRLLEQAAKLNPAQPALLQKMADTYKAVGELARAADLYLDLLKKHPQLSQAAQPIIREQLIRLYLAGGQREKAAEQLKEILKDNPTNPQAYFLLGALATDDKHYEAALGYYEKALLLNDDLELAYYDLAGTQLTLGHPDQAIETLTKARNRFPATFLLEFYTGLAQAALKQYAEALKNFTAAEVQARVTEPSRLTHSFYCQVGQAYAGLASQASSGGHPADAERLFGEAEKLFRKSLEVAPDNSEACFQVGTAYERMATRSVSLHQAAEADRFFAEAEKQLRHCLQLAPEDAEALNYLGYSWADRGLNLPEARQFIEKAVKLEPDNAAYLDSLAWVLFKLKQPEEALPHMLKAVKNSEKPDSTLFDHLGDIYEALGRHAEARDAWNKSLAVEENPEIRKKLETPVAPPGKS